MRKHIVLCVVIVLFAATAAMAANVTFESPDYTPGPLSGQAGGGITWWEFEADSSGEIAAGGYNSPQAARLDVDELANPQSGAMESDGDDMLAFFPATEQFVVSAMSYAHLNPNPDNGGAAREAYFYVSDLRFHGSAIVWAANGNIHTQAVQTLDSGVPIVYDAWVPFSMRIDYPNNQITTLYNGTQILQSELSGSGTAADQINTWLTTIASANNPDPADYLLFDNITIEPLAIPEPGSLAMLLGLGVGILAAHLRRRKRHHAPS